MASLKQDLTHLFEEKFGSKPEYFFQAPACINLMGEPANYHQGFVLPCAINYRTLLAASARGDEKIVVTSANFQGEMTDFELTVPMAASVRATWCNYLKGVATNLIDRGFSLRGANIALSGDIPMAEGLGSSASLEVIAALALTHMSGYDLDAKDLAVIGQEAETDYIGVKCSVMKQMVCALGKKNHALLLDCRSQESQQISIPDELTLLAIDPNKKRALINNEFNSRHHECEKVVRHFKVRSIRDISLDDLEAEKTKLEATAYRRARHIISENDRTQQAAAGLASGNIKLMSQLMAQSHVSIQEDFGLNVPAINAIVDIVSQVVGEHGGVRMMGGSLGNNAVALIAKDRIGEVKTAITQEYTKRTGLEAVIYEFQTSHSASILANE